MRRNSSTAPITANDHPIPWYDGKFRAATMPTKIRTGYKNHRIIKLAGAGDGVRIQASKDINSLSYNSIYAKIGQNATQ